ncbi:MAG: recombinase family protein [Clostridia bacterium]
MESTARELYIINPSVSQMPQKLKVAGYARVSSNSDDQLNSFSAQVNNYTNYINQNKEWQFVEVYADEGISGVSLEKRKDFNRMIEDCRNGKIDRIVTKSSSRFGRNTLDNLTILRELKEIGVSVFFEKENIDTAKIQGEMLVTLYSVFAQQESINISQNVKKGIRMRMANGTYVSGSVPYGYRMIDKQLEIYEPEAEVVRTIFKKYINGKSSVQIATDLNKHNAPKKECTIKWTYKNVLNILKNEKYKGDTLCQKAFREDAIPYQKKTNNGQLPKYYINETHEEIVTEFQFAIATLLIGVRNQGKNHIAKEYHLSKKLICSECGSKYRRKVSNSIVYYACVKHDLNKSDCSAVRIAEKDVYDIFIKMYNKLKLNYKYILIPYLQGLEKLQELSNKDNTQINDINKKIADKSEQICSMNGLLESGILDSAIFIPQNDLLNKELTELKQEKSRLISNSDSSSDIKNTEELIDVFESGPSKLTEFNEILFKDIVKEIKIGKNKELHFILINNITINERK